MPDASPDITAAAVPASLGTTQLDVELAKLGKEAQTERAEAQTERTKAQAAIDAARARLEKIDESADAVKPPTFEEIPPPPTPPHADPWQTFGSPAMILAVLGGFLTQTPLTTALNAGAKVMQATAAGNAAETQRQMDIWKASVANAQKANDFELSKYRAAIERLATDRSEALAELNAWTSAFNNTRFRDVIASGDDKAILGYYADMTKNGDAIAKAAPQVQAWDAFIRAKISDNAGKPLTAQQTLDAFKEFQGTSGGGLSVPKMQAQSATLRARAAELPDTDPQKAQLNEQADDLDAAIAKTKSAETANVISDDDAMFVAKRVWAGDPSALKNISRNQANMSKVLTAVRKWGEQQGKSQFDLLVAEAGVQADQRSLANLQKMTDAAVSFERTAELNFENALRVKPDDPNLGPWLNRWIMQGETVFGDPNIPAYVAAVMTGANEYAKIMAGSTGAQGSTVDSRREAAELFNPYLNTGQLEKVVTIAKQDMKNRQRSLNEQLDTIKERMAGEGIPTAPQAEPQRAMLNGRQIEVRGGKWIYSDTGEDVPQ